ncbi:hypothetical protein MNBD_GAMMA11-316 [hydrothermal vent metagenome]|uniref:Uncharacterized protein n=1 Tax=hydrothermal vent metagenome TaxID=652676 RepID=A0A3B0Y1G8_9ZZZZ
MFNSVFLKSCVIACSIAMSTTLFLQGCSSGSGGGSTQGTGQNYSGPGSKWDISLAGDGTFNIIHYPSIGANSDYTVQGNYIRQSSGFVTLTVTGGSGTGNPPVGSEAWAIEVPGYAFLLRPVDDDQLVAMVTSGACPTADIDANWVVVKKDDNFNGNAGADLADNDFFGTFNYDSATDTASLPVFKSLTSGFPSLTADTFPNGSCSGGIMELGDAAMYLTITGGAIVHIGVDTPNDATDDSFIFALTQKAITNVNNLDASYAGILFDDNMDIGQQISPVKLTCTSGSCAGSLVSNVITGAAVQGATAEVELTGTVDSIAPGLITGTISYDGTVTGNLACMADINALSTGKKIISCVGQSPDDNQAMFNVIFVSI